MASAAGAGRSSLGGESDNNTLPRPASRASELSSYTASPTASPAQSDRASSRGRRRQRGRSSSAPTQAQLRKIDRAIPEEGTPHSTTGAAAAAAGAGAGATTQASQARTTVAERRRAFAAGSRNRSVRVASIRGRGTAITRSSSRARARARARPQGKTTQATEYRDRDHERLDHFESFRNRGLFGRPRSSSAMRYDEVPSATEAQALAAAAAGLVIEPRRGSGVADDDTRHSFRLIPSRDTSMASAAIARQLTTAIGALNAATTAHHGSRSPTAEETAVANQAAAAIAAAGGEDTRVERLVANAARAAEPAPAPAPAPAPDPAPRLGAGVGVNAEHITIEMGGAAGAGGGAGSGVGSSRGSSSRGRGRGRGRGRTSSHSISDEQKQINTIIRKLRYIRTRYLEMLSDKKGIDTITKAKKYLFESIWQLSNEIKGDTTIIGEAQDSLQGVVHLTATQILLYNDNIELTIEKNILIRGNITRIRDLEARAILVKIGRSIIPSISPSTPTKEIVEQVHDRQAEKLLNGSINYKGTARERCIANLAGTTVHTTDEARAARAAGGGAGAGAGAATVTEPTETIARSGAHSSASDSLLVHTPQRPRHAAAAAADVRLEMLAEEQAIPHKIELTAEDIACQHAEDYLLLMQNIRHFSSNDDAPKDHTVLLPIGFVKDFLQELAAYIKTNGCVLEEELEQIIANACLLPKDTNEMPDAARRRRVDTRTCKSRMKKIVTTLGRFASTPEQKALLKGLTVAVAILPGAITALNYIAPKDEDTLAHPTVTTGLPDFNCTDVARPQVPVTELVYSTRHGNVIIPRIQAILTVVAAIDAALANKAITTAALRAKIHKAIAFIVEITAAAGAGLAIYQMSPDEYWSQGVRITASVAAAVGALVAGLPVARDAKETTEDRAKALFKEDDESEYRIVEFGKNVLIRSATLENNLFYFFLFYGASEAAGKVNTEVLTNVFYDLVRSQIYLSQASAQSLVKEFLDNFKPWAVGLLVGTISIGAIRSGCSTFANKLRAEIPRDRDTSGLTYLVSKTGITYETEARELTKALILAAKQTGLIHNDISEEYPSSSQKYKLKLNNFINNARRFFSNIPITKITLSIFITKFGLTIYDNLGELTNLACGNTYPEGATPFNITGNLYFMADLSTNALAPLSWKVIENILDDLAPVTALAGIVSISAWLQNTAFARQLDSFGGILSNILRMITQAAIPAYFVENIYGPGTGQSVIYGSLLTILGSVLGYLAQGTANQTSMGNLALWLTSTPAVMYLMLNELSAGADATAATFTSQVPAIEDNTGGDDDYYGPEYERDYSETTITNNGDTSALTTLLLSRVPAAAIATGAINVIIALIQKNTRETNIADREKVKRKGHQMAVQGETTKLALAWHDATEEDRAAPAPPTPTTNRMDNLRADLAHRVARARSSSRQSRMAGAGAGAGAM